MRLNSLEKIRLYQKEARSCPRHVLELRLLDTLSDIREFHLLTTTLHNDAIVHQTSKHQLVHRNQLLTATVEALTRQIRELETQMARAMDELRNG